MNEHKLAVFVRADGSESVCGEWAEDYAPYVRQTEWVSVVFPKLKDNDLIFKQLNMIDAAEKELRNQFQDKLNALTDRRSKLMALTLQPVAGE